MAKKKIIIGSVITLFTWDELVEQGFEFKEIDEDEGYDIEEMTFEDLDLSKAFFNMTDFSEEHEVVYVDEDFDFKICKDHYTIPNQMIKSIIQN